ncbi:MAG TPA: hypothetical protein VMR62_21800 [Bryobacteraceae bacterium]|jgi:hypothetical protein|nr:hypothetical protein [Bryobacteraceae bacterium]
MKTIRICSGVLAVLAAMLPSAAYAQAGAIQAKLQSEYQLTKTTDDQSEIVTAGSVLILHKDKVMMSAGNPCMNVFRDGQITPTGMCKAGNKLKRFHITLDEDAPATRNFVSGEKFWLTRIEVRDTGKERGVVLGFFSDPIDDVRFKGAVMIPFGTSMPAPEEALRMVSEVVTVAPSEDASGGEQAPPASQHARPAPPPSQLTAARAFRAPAEAAPPPLELPPPAPADPTVVAEGQTVDQIVAALGQPVKKAKIGTKEIYYYKDLKVTFVDGKVKDVS